MIPDTIQLVYDPTNQYLVKIKALLKTIYDEGNTIGSKDVYDKISVKTNGSAGIDGADEFVVVY